MHSKQLNLAENPTFALRNDTPSGGQSTQIKYLSKSTDTYTKILLQ